jgi:hypothetical protein
MDRGRSFDLSRLPTADKLQLWWFAPWATSASTLLSSPVSAQGGVASPLPSRPVSPEAILWMQSGHAQDVAARRYVQLRSPKLLYRTWEAFKF